MVDYIIVTMNDFRLCQIGKWVSLTLAAGLVVALSSHNIAAHGHTIALQLFMLLPAWILFSHSKPYAGLITGVSFPLIEICSMASNGGALYGIHALEALCLSLLLASFWGIARLLRRISLHFPKLWTWLIACALAAPIALLSCDFLLSDIYRHSCEPEELEILHYIMPALAPCSIIALMLSVKYTSCGDRILCAAGALIWPVSAILCKGVCGHEPYGDYGLYLAVISLSCGLAASTLPATNRRLLHALYLTLTIPAIQLIGIIYQLSGISSFFHMRG